jgi:hypothetical protein
MISRTWSRLPMVAALLLMYTAESLPQALQPGAPGVAAVDATAFIGGVVVRSGSNEPISEIDVELSRVEGTAEAPLTAGAVAYFRTALQGFGQSGAFPPAVVANEIFYAKTGPDGRFAFRNLKPGKYRLVAVRSAVGISQYPVEYGQRDPRARGMNFPVRAGESLADLRMEMSLPGVITGTVFDYDGEPMGHVSVLALVVQYKDGRITTNIENVAHTDARGQYRLSRLGPGKYYVAAVVQDPFRKTVREDSSPPGRRGPTERATSPYITRRFLPSGELVEEAYGVVYNGSVRSIEQARPMDIQLGTVFNGVDIALAAGRSRVRHIRGIATDATGRPIAGATVFAHPQQWSSNVHVALATTDGSGVFDLAVAAGDYFVSVTHDAPVAAGSPAPATRSRQVAFMPISVSGSDVEGVRLTAQSGIPVAGRLLSEAPGLALPAGIRVTLTRIPDIDRLPPAVGPLPLPTDPAAPRITPGQPDAAGNFTLPVFPGDYAVSVEGLPESLYVKSMRMGGVDLTSAPFRMPAENAIEIILGADAGTASGRVVESSLTPATNVVVALVPDAASDRLRPALYKNTTTGPDGRFAFSNVRPGFYRLFAWDYAEPGIWTIPSRLQPQEGQGRLIEIKARSEADVQLTTLPGLR